MDSEASGTGSNPNGYAGVVRAQGFVLWLTPLAHIAVAGGLGYIANAGRHEGSKARYCTKQLWPIDGRPLGSLSWLQQNLFSYNKTLEADQIILTGTTLGLYTVRAGDQLNVSLNDETILNCLIQ